MSEANSKSNAISQELLQILAECVEARNIDELKRIGEATAQILEFDSYLYGCLLANEAERHEKHIWSSQPLVWREQYERRGLMAHDPTVAYCLRNVRAARWQDIFASPLGDNRKARELLEEARMYGLVDGIAVPLPSDPMAPGMLCLARDNEISEFEFEQLAPAAQLFGMYFHEAALSLLRTEEERHLQPPHLTSREIGCLQWAADGKTSSEIGEIMKIAESTVVAHLTTAQRKLNASNRTHAVAKAIFLKCIYF